MVVRHRCDAQKGVGAGQSHGKARAAALVREPSSKVLEGVGVRRAWWNGRRPARKERDEDDYAGCPYNVAIR
jgi:hypothetical protein